MSDASARYREELRNHYWAYQVQCFPDFAECFDPRYIPPGSPPVFRSEHARKNVIVNPAATEEEAGRLLKLVPPHARHMWFRSMNSSQALAQSVLGNLEIRDQLHCLAALRSDDGEPLLGRADASSSTFSMEHGVNHLGEPRRTSVDAFIGGEYGVAIECKFTESEFGTCSRPRLTPQDSNYAVDYCIGAYTQQQGRTERCALSEIGVKYWHYIPQLFHWQNDTDLAPCPLHRHYQLVRNVLAACVRPDGGIAPQGGHVLVIYDERNPAFCEGGRAWAEYAETRGALKDPALLRKCSWQHIAHHLRDNAILPWLTEAIAIKYGF